MTFDIHLSAGVALLCMLTDYTAIDGSLAETYHTLTLPKRSQRVGVRLREVITKQVFSVLFHSKYCSMKPGLH